jgi:hypothetical protein
MIRIAYSTGNAIEGRHRLEGSTLVAPGVVAGNAVGSKLIRSREVGHVPQNDEAIRIRKGGRSQQGGIENAENERVGANAKRQRERGHRGKARRSAKIANAIPQIGCQGIDQAQPTRRTNFFLDPLDGSELDPRAPLCILAGHTGLDEMIHARQCGL